MAKSTDANEAVVVDSTGHEIRTYTRDVHGDEFAELANEFSSHTPGSSVNLQ